MGGRDGGASRTSDGRLEVELSTPGSSGTGAYWVGQTDLTVFVFSMECLRRKFPLYLTRYNDRLRTNWTIERVRETYRLGVENDSRGGRRF
jgi:hypothetical protein